MIFLPEALKAFRRKFPDAEVRIVEGVRGTGAVTRVLIDTSDGERVWTTVGVHANVTTASWMALCDSLEFGLLGSR